MRTSPTARYVTHMFDMRCREHGIEHRLTKINHPWTNGQVERMNRTIKEATVQRYHYDSHKQLRLHLDQFATAYNYGRRLKTLKGLTPHEFICNCWASEPQRFTLNPYYQLPGPNTASSQRDSRPRAPAAPAKGDCCPAQRMPRIRCGPNGPNQDPRCSWSRSLS